ncbi:hypothetical protein [Listeria immobilis]|uniref:Uncharacterized protein n=1 Tax=Listeria immobilis TaxID=2713502 RepID=A0ABR6STX9_9LIST|nr:hypothetical protein [Listeria immobilis]MBC1482049.1 hypothetical protein [Listeria immobilis]MBC1505439.1 hypothetical protein [Listeria immobilis]MBC1509128.1 hypothetical protein [Listeria immobilis]MBC1514587.1 hypothetical protein [Listeria immobilis]MBC6303923.1 hypothetical protein [Listeria immobilis]
MNYKKWIGYLLFFIILFSLGTLIFNNFNIIVLVVATVSFAIAIIPFVRNKRNDSAK